MAISRREAVYATVARENTGHVPYALNFTLEAGQKLAIVLGSSANLDDAIGNCFRWIQPPWWEFADLPDGQREAEPPPRLPRIRGCGSISYDEFNSTVARLRETTDCFLVASISGALFVKGWQLRGMDNLLVDMVSHEEYCETLFDLILAADLNMLEMVLSSDVDGVLLGDDWGTQKALFMSPDLWRRYIAPRHARIWSQVRQAGKIAMLHSCGNILDVLPELADIGVQILNPVQPECMDIAAVKQRAGGRLTLWGGISTQRTLPWGTPEDVRRAVRETAAKLGADGGYITAPAQYVQGDVPLENSLALIEEARALFGEMTVSHRPVQYVPAHKVSATWGASVQLIAYEITHLGDDTYRLLLQYRCLQKVEMNWARITHLVPSDPAGLETDADRQFGLKNWDGVLEPPTTTWEPGGTYVVSAEGKLPHAGAPWTLVLGMAELVDGRAGGRIRDVQLTDAGTMARVSQAPWVAIPAAVRE